MRTALLMLFTALLVGCETTGQPRHVLEREQTIEAGMRERYDFTALAAFLKQVVEEHPVFEHVDLTSTKIADNWQIERVDPPSRMRSGDWVIWDANQGDDEFDLYYMFDERKGRSVTIRARRLARDRFELVGLSVEEWIEMTRIEANRVPGTDL